MDCHEETQNSRCYLSADLTEINTNQGSERGIEPQKFHVV